MRVSKISDLQDVCCWNQTSNGKFTVKSSYETIKKLDWAGIDSKWIRIWRLPAPQWIRMVMWLFGQNRLLTNS